MAVGDQERIGTPALGVHIIKETRDQGNAGPVSLQDDVVAVQTAADLLTEAINRAATQAVKLNNGHNGNGNGKKQELGAWVRWAGGLLLTLLVLVWGGSVLLASKTDEAKVEHMIETSPQHPDSKADLAKHEAELQIQKLQLNTIEGTVKNIDKTLTDIKKDLKEKR